MAAIPLLDSALAGLQAEGDSTNMARGYYYLAMAHMYIGDLGRCLDANQRGLKISQALGDQKQLANNHQLFGTLYSELGNYSRAAEHQLQSVRLAEQGFDKPYKLVNAYANMGNIYDLSGQAEKARSYFHKALSVLDSLAAEIPEQRKSMLLGSIHMSLGVLDKLSGDYDAALAHYALALPPMQQTGDPVNLIRLRSNQGLLLLEMGDFDASMAHLQKGFRLADSLGLNHSLLYLHGMMAEWHLKKGTYSQGKEHAQQALALAEQARSTSMQMEAHFSLYKLAKAQNNMLEALQRHESYHSLSDSVFNEGEVRKLERLQAQFDHEKQLLADSLEWVTKVNALELEQAEEKHASQLILGIVSGGAALLALIALFVFRSLKQRNRLAEKSVENARLREEKLRAELNFKAKELSALALRLVEKNQLLSDLQTGLNTTEEEPEQVSISRMNRLIEKNFSLEKDWEVFQAQFENVHQNFFTSLKRKCPELTPRELRVLGMMKVNLESHEIASVLGISGESVKKTRYRIHKKLALPKGKRLADFVLQYQAS